jgi:hypothetical protein
VFEVVETDVGSKMFADGWATKKEVKRFTRTANSRHAIGGEARHGHNRFQPPKRPMSHSEAHDLVLGLVRRWLAHKAPPQPAREVVIEVKPGDRGATISDEVS